jgi:transposase
LLAHIAVMKYGYQLPLYRQEQMFAAQGIMLDRQTLVSWMGRVAWWLKALHSLMSLTFRIYAALLPEVAAKTGSTALCTSQRCIIRNAGLT